MEKYSKISKVGKGSFGTVWLVKSRRNEAERFILKEVSLKGLPPSERKATMNEVAVLQKLHHPYIIAYRESFIERDGLGIVMEWAAGGDLGSLIEGRKRARRPFSENEVLRWSHQLISALSYCHHELRLLHRDLKPANVFLSASGDVKLGDFGISKLLAYSMDLARTQCGTPLYMSPEQCGGKAYARAADVWAVGCVLYELMTLAPPWMDKLGAAGPGGIRGLMRVIIHGRLDVSLLRRLGYSSDLCGLLSALLAKEPAVRPKLNAVLQWPLLQKAAAAAPAPPTPRREAARQEAADAAAAAHEDRELDSLMDDVMATERAAGARAAAAIQRSFRRSRGGGLRRVAEVDDAAETMRDALADARKLPPHSPRRQPPPAAAAGARLPGPRFAQPAYMKPTAGAGYRPRPTGGGAGNGPSIWRPADGGAPSRDAQHAAAKIGSAMRRSLGRRAFPAGLHCRAPPQPPTRAAPAPAPAPSPYQYGAPAPAPAPAPVPKAPPSEPRRPPPGVDAYNLAMRERAAQMAAERADALRRHDAAPTPATPLQPAPAAPATPASAPVTPLQPPPDMPPPRQSPQSPPPPPSSQQRPPRRQLFQDRDEVPAAAATRRQWEQQEAAAARPAPQPREQEAAAKILRSFRRSVGRRRRRGTVTAEAAAAQELASPPVSAMERARARIAAKGAEAAAAAAEPARPAAEGRRERRGSDERREGLGVGALRQQQAAQVAQAAARMQQHFGAFAPCHNARHNALAAAKIQNVFRNSIDRRRAADGEEPVERRSLNRRRRERPRSGAGHVNRAPPPAPPPRAQLLRVQPAPPAPLPRHLHQPCYQQQFQAAQQHAAQRAAGRPYSAPLRAHNPPPQPQEQRPVFNMRRPFASPRIDQLAQPRAPPPPRPLHGPVWVR